MADITVNLDNLKDAEREQLLALIEKAKEPQDNRWKPASGEEYYLLQGNGDIIHSSNDNMSIDKKRFAIGNYFRTREDIEFAIERLKVFDELKQFASTEHGGKDARFYLYYESGRKAILTDDTSASIYTGELRFATKELADKAIATVGADRIKKYYFGITE